MPPERLQRTATAWTLTYEYTDGSAKSSRGKERIGGAQLTTQGCPWPTPLWRIICSSAEAFSGVHQELPALSICPEKVLINPPNSNWLADPCDGAFQPREIDVTGAEDPGPWWDSALIS